jgi:hypothetical protein
MINNGQDGSQVTHQLFKFSQNESGESFKKVLNKVCVTHMITKTRHALVPCSIDCLLPSSNSTQYEIVSSVDASDCSPLEFFKKNELESSPFPPSLKQLPSGFINKMEQILN